MLAIMVRAGVRSTSDRRARGTWFLTGFPIPSLSTFAHKPPLRSPACRHSSRRSQMVAGDSYTPPRAINAQATRAILFANATATSIFGLRASIRSSHDSFSLTCLAVCQTTAIAPIIKSCLRSRWPIFDIFPRRVLPPVEFCFGVCPSQAAKSRPLEKVDVSGERATIAAAVIGPIPGTFISRRAVSSDCAAFLTTSSSV